MLDDYYEDIDNFWAEDLPKQKVDKEEKDNFKIEEAIIEAVGEVKIKKIEREMRLLHYFNYTYIDFGFYADPAGYDIGYPKCEKINDYSFALSFIRLDRYIRDDWLKDWFMQLKWAVPNRINLFKYYRN